MAETHPPTGLVCNILCLLWSSPDWEVWERRGNQYLTEAYIHRGGFRGVWNQQKILNFLQKNRLRKKKSIKISLFAEFLTVISPNYICSVIAKLANKNIKTKYILNKFLRFYDLHNMSQHFVMKIYALFLQICLDWKTGFRRRYHFLDVWSEDQPGDACGHWAGDRWHPGSGNHHQCKVSSPSKGITNIFSKAKDPYLGWG